MNQALLIVDVQRDFCDGGTFPARDTTALLEKLSQFVEDARERKHTIVFTQDWHPATHKSFIPNGGRWPVHCVANSRGAELMPPLRTLSSDLVVHKGESRDAGGYSAFEFTGLADELRSFKVQSLAVCGIATEYCVRATVLDAVEAGFKVVLLTDLICAIDPDASLSVLGELRNSGVELSRCRAWLNE